MNLKVATHFKLNAHSHLDAYSKIYTRYPTRIGCFSNMLYMYASLIKLYDI